MNSEDPLTKALEDASSLAERLRGTETQLDSLISDLDSVKHVIQNMQTYQEESMTLAEITKATQKNPRAPLILCLAAENKQLSELQSQNSVLSTAIADYEAALELIMTKYRLHMTNMMHGSESGKDDHQSDADGTAKKEAVDIQASAKRIAELERKLKAVTELATDVVDQSNQYSLHLNQELQQLRCENAGLRELLGIANSEAAPMSNEMNNADCGEETSNEEPMRTNPGPFVVSDHLPGKEGQDRNADSSSDATLCD